MMPFRSYGRRGFAWKHCRGLLGLAFFIQWPTAAAEGTDHELKSSRA